MRLGLIILVLFTSQLQASRNIELNKIKNEWQKAYRAKDWDRAIEVGLKHVKLSTKKARPSYNLSCAYALSGDKDKAVHWLGMSAERGWGFVGTMLRDKDLDSIRDHPDYPLILAKMKANNAHNLEAFKHKTGDAIIRTFIPDRYDATKPAPLIVALHGMGSNADQFSRTWKPMANDFGAILAAPQGMSRMSNGGFHWGTVEEGVYLINRTIDKVSQQYSVDPDRIILTGFSQGASVSFIFAMRHPDRIAGVIPVAGFYDHAVAPVSSMTGAAKPRFYIMNGANDVEADNNRWACKLLNEAGIKAEVKIFPNVGHAFPPNYPAEFKKAIAFVLGK